MKQPFVFINMAMTADGKIATADRALSSFSSKRDFEHLLKLRATADAVMSGARTVDSGPINLGPGPERFRRLRRKHGLAEYNLRVIVSGSGSINPGAEIFRHRFSPILILTRKGLPKKRLQKLRQAADAVGEFGERRLDLTAALNWLRKEWHVKRLLCEGGGELNAALLQAGVVNELHLTICPKIFGGASAPTIADGTGIAKIHDALHLRLKSFKRIGAEVFTIWEVNAGPKRSLHSC